MKKYKFPQFNIEIIDPAIQVNPIVNDLNPNAMTLTANVILETDTAKFGVQLTDVPVNDLNYNYDELVARVTTKLQEYEI